jgi:hypothetical protein
VIQTDLLKVEAEAKKATDEDLAVMRELPLIQRGMQTDSDEFNAYLVGLGANFGKKMSRSSAKASTENAVGTNCRMLDSEQVNCFILDSLCNEKYLQKIIEEKRKYENVMNYDAIDDDTMEGEVGGAIGGIKLK